MPPTTEDDPLYGEAQMLAGAKKLALFTAGAASQKYMTALADQQEVMADLADIIIQVYRLNRHCFVPASCGRVACPLLTPPRRWSASTRPRPWTLSS